MPRGVRRRELLAVLAAAAAGCTGPDAAAPTVTDTSIETGTDAKTGTTAVTTGGALGLTSPAFDDGEPIPEKYGKDYGNVNPPLRVSGVPKGADSLALIVDDPDAPGGVFDHWLVWNVPPDTTEIPEGWDPPSGVVQGENDFGNVGYDGPRPPSEHTYRFELSALDATLELARGATSDELAGAMDGHVLAGALLEGTFAP